MERLGRIITLEEQMWRQRAKKIWLKQGDRNMTYFHTVASIQKRRNWIANVEEDGQGYTSHLCLLRGSSTRPSKT
jgi:hypothetical protein